MKTAEKANLTHPPFPLALGPRKKELNKEIMEVFKWVKINIPFLNAIKQIHMLNFLKICVPSRGGWMLKTKTKQNKKTKIK